MKAPYISGPMSHHDFHNFPAFFEAEHRLRELGYEPLNPARNTGDDWEEAYDNTLKNPRTWEACIRLDAGQVLKSDGIVLLRGWGHSKGACLEVVLSVAVGNRIALYSEDPYSQDISLLPIDREHAYLTALSKLHTCGLGPAIPAVLEQIQSSSL